MFTYAKNLPRSNYHRNSRSRFHTRIPLVTYQDSISFEFENKPTSNSITHTQARTLEPADLRAQAAVQHMFNTNYIFLRTYITNLDTSSTESALGVKSFSFQTCVSLIEVFRKQLKDRTNAYGSVHIWFIWTSNPRCQAWHLNSCRVLYFNHNFQFIQKCNATKFITSLTPPLFDGSYHLNSQTR